MSEDKKDRIVLSEHADCPHCNKRIMIEKIRTQIQPGMAAKYEDTIEVKKDDQTKLE